MNLFGDEFPWLVRNANLHIFFGYSTTSSILSAFYNLAGDFIESLGQK